MNVNVHPHDEKTVGHSERRKRGARSFFTLLSSLVQDVEIIGYLLWLRSSSPPSARALKRPIY